MKDKLNYWKQKLREQGLKCTPQRQLILRVMVEAGVPLSVREIYTKITDNSREMRLSTVYRNLNSFVEKQLVKKLEFGKKESYFELRDEHHHHLICIRCGEIRPLDCPLGDYLEQVSSRASYELVDHSLKIYGICSECKD